MTSNTGRRELQVLVNRRPVVGAWGGGNSFCKAIHDAASRCGIRVHHRMIPHLDAILVVDPRYDELRISHTEVEAYKQVFPRTKVVFRVNECDERKGDVDVINPMIRSLGQKSDLVIFISEWLQGLHLAGGFPSNRKRIVLRNGAFKNLYGPPRPRNDGKVNVVTHHWSSHQMKGQDIYEKLDRWVSERSDRYTFTYIGRTQSKFIGSTHVSPLYGKDLADLLGTFDVYVTGSLWDPGPNHVVEAVAAGLPTYVHHDGGGGPEVVGPKFTYRTFDELADLLEIGRFERTDRPVVDWTDLADTYWKSVRQVVEGASS